MDVLSFGATKNGALGVEAVIFFDRGLASDFLYRRKRAGQLVSKGRYLGAQMLAYLDDDLWLANARHANRMADDLAARLRAIPDVRLPLAVDANEVFAIVPRSMHDALEAVGARYLEWPGEGPGTDVVGPRRGVHPPADVVPHHRRRGADLRSTRSRPPRGVGPAGSTGDEIGQPVDQRRAQAYRRSRASTASGRRRRRRRRPPPDR